MTQSQRNENINDWSKLVEYAESETDFLFSHSPTGGHTTSGA